MSFVLIQAIGYVGLVFAVLAFQCKSHKRVMICRTLNELFFAVQYVCLGSYTGAAMNVIGSIRNMSFAHCVEQGKSTRMLQFIFAGIFIVGGLITNNGKGVVVGIMVIAAKVVSTIAYGIKNTTIIRLLTLPTSMCWLVYNIAANSTAGILCESLTIVSIIIGIFRIDIPEARERRRAKKYQYSTMEAPVEEQ